MRGVTRRAGPDRAPILHNLNLDLPTGGILNIAGPSGAGKTRLLRLVNRLDEATAGEVAVLGRPISQWQPRELRTRVSMVFQKPSLMGMTVRENLDLPFRFTPRPPGDIERRRRQALSLAGVDPDFLDRTESNLSAGQVQRVTVARSLMRDPEVLLLDEPTAGLDPRAAHHLLDGLKALQEERTLTLMLVTHKLSEALRMGGRLLVLVGGAVGAVGDVEELVTSPPPGPGGDYLRKRDG
jgi:ABC-type methionine transport system ATPase subunit